MGRDWNAIIPGRAAAEGQKPYDTATCHSGTLASCTQKKVVNRLPKGFVWGARRRSASCPAPTGSDHVSVVNVARGSVGAKNPSPLRPVFTPNDFKERQADSRGMSPLVVSYVVVRA